MVVALALLLIVGGLWLMWAVLVGQRFPWEPAPATATSSATTRAGSRPGAGPA